MKPLQLLLSNTAQRDPSIIKNPISRGKIVPLPLTVTAERCLIGFYYYTIPGNMWSSNAHLLRHLCSLILVGDAFRPFMVLSGGLKKESKRGEERRWFLGCGQCGG